MSEIYLGKPSDEMIGWCQNNYSGPLCFTGLELSSSIYFLKPTESNIHLQYSVDNLNTWNNYNFTEGRHGDTIELSSCEDNKVYFRADPENPNSTFANCACKLPSGLVAASGNIQYLLDSTGQRKDVPDSCYRQLFRLQDNLVQAPILTATILSMNCYKDMFNGCSNLSSAQMILPATTLADGCHQTMFSSCKKLVKAPKIAAKTMANSCCSQMFRLCSALSGDYALPATTLASRCYYSMFQGDFISCAHLPASMQGVYDPTVHGNTYALSVVYDL